MEHEDTDEEVKKELQKMFDELFDDPEFWNRVGKSLWWQNEIRGYGITKLEFNNYDDDNR